LLVALALAWTALGLAASFYASLQPAWAFAGLVLALAAAVDALAVWREPRLRIERQVAGNLPVGSASNVTITVHNDGERRYRLALFDHHPPFATAEPLPQQLALVPGEQARLTYRLTPQRRGDAGFGATEVRLHSRLGLWRRHRRLGDPLQVKVYPNFARISNYMLLATDNRLSLLGVRQRPRRGGGLEFHQLREYRDGDSLTQIDWKATSRYRKLISREYQDERDQQVVFLLDCGRRMRAEDFGTSHFDESLNAMLLLAYVALHQGDAVGFLAMGGVRRWVPPRKGPAALNLLLNRAYDLHPTAEASDYVAAAQELLVKQRRRALVVMLTNTRDEDQPELATAARLLRQKHLVLLANLREGFFDTALQTTVERFEESLRYVATIDLLARRERAHHALANIGVQTLDVTAPQLPLAVVNRYLDIKRAGQL
jgi:uncharacterized protein (DUF58 family)